MFRRTLPRNDVICLQCGATFTPKQFGYANCKFPAKFCNRSCAASYRNAHKTCGYRRSKLEQWIQYNLSVIYPTLEVIYNSSKYVGAELDIFIPALKIAFELNGIFHYEPIYGEKSLDSIKQRDQNKFKLCHEHGVSLCVIDISSQSYFKVKSSQKYLDIIKNIIDQHLSMH
jgi:hypothetical protein